MSSDNSSRKQHRQTRNVAQSSIISSGILQSQSPQDPHSPALSTGLDATAMIPSTPPRTPRKNHDLVSAPKSNSVPLENSTRQRSKNKARTKNVNASPATATSQRQNSPPKSAGLSSASRPISTPSSKAYAGSTFHASPAPSALPMPSFYSRSVPESPAGRLLARNKGSSNNVPSGTTSIPENAGDPARESTPLDFLFEADRLEKERARSATSNQRPTTQSGPFEPPYSPSHIRTPPTKSGQPRPGDNHRYSGSMFPFEMDSPSSSKSPVGPAFSTPYNERIKAARASSQSHVPQVTNSHASLKSDDLKRYLFDGILPPQPAFKASAQPQPSPNRDVQESYGNTARRPSQTPQNSIRYSGLRQEVTPTKTPNGTPDRNLELGQSPNSARSQWSHMNNNYGVPTTNPAIHFRDQTNSTVPAPIQHSTNDLTGLDSHLRSVLNLGPNKQS